MKFAPSLSFPLRAAAAIALLFAASMSAPAALAQHGHDRGQRAGPGPEHRGAGHQWHGNIARFHEHDWNVWRGGHWSHARHGGRLGWWWVIGPSWYYYPGPVYPYPSPWEPADGIVAMPMPPAQFWYYCEALNTYYPYATACPSGWKAVPATPDAIAPAPIPQVP